MYFIIGKSVVHCIYEITMQYSDYNELWNEGIIILYGNFLKRFTKVFNNYLYFGNIDRITTSVNYARNANNTTVNIC